MKSVSTRPGLEWGRQRNLQRLYDSLIPKGLFLIFGAIFLLVVLLEPFVPGLTLDTAKTICFLVVGCSLTVLTVLWSVTRHRTIAQEVYNHSREEPESLGSVHQASGAAEREQENQTTTEVRNMSIFEAKRVRISYVYGFLLEGYNEDCVKKLEDEKRLDELDITWLTEDAPPGDSPWIIKPILRPNVRFLKFAAKVTPKEIEAGEKVEIKSFARDEVLLSGRLWREAKLYNTGCGTFRLTLDVKEEDAKVPLDASRIVQLANVAERTPEEHKEHPVEHEEDREEPLVLRRSSGDIIFWNEYEKFVKAVCMHLQGKNVRCIDTQAVESAPASAQEKPGEIWLLNTATGQELRPQFPYCIVCGEVDPIVYRDLKAASGAQTEVLKEIGKILFKSPRKPDTGAMTEFGFIDEKTEKLKNFYGVENLFINFGFRVALLLYPSPKSKYPDPRGELLEETTVEALRVIALETFELIRLRWYVYGMGNIWLDRKIEDVDSWMKAIETGHVPELWNYLRDRIKERLKFKGMLLRFFEDPVLYRIGSASFNEIYSRASTLFRYEQMENLLFQKLQALDRAFDDVFDLVRTSELVEIETKV